MNSTDPLHQARSWILLLGLAAAVGPTGCGDNGGSATAAGDGGTTADAGTTDAGNSNGGADAGTTGDAGTAGDAGTVGDGGTATEDDCGNGDDDDGDGLTDCEDDDCALADGCYEADCTDGVDDDSDGLTDCEDADCLGNPFCPELDCGNGDDDDGDGYADCLDADCVDSSDCRSEDDCGNAVDDDEDGLIDCEDSDCATADGCYEADCTDGLDDDGDGAIDCSDGDCYLRTGCVETICDDGLDDDGDGGIDCLDVDCYVSRACMAACTEGDPGAVTTGEIFVGSTAKADDSFDDVGTCGADGGVDSAFIYEVPAEGCYVLSTEGSDFDTVLRLYESCETSDELTCADDYDDEDLTSRLYVDGAAGDLYVVAVDGYDDTTSGAFTVGISEYDVPWEEDIGSVTGDAAWTGSIDGLEDLDWLLSCGAYNEYDELLLWTAPADGTYTFDLSDSTFDTVLGIVAVGDRCPEELACNDDELYPDILTSTASAELVLDQQVVIWVSSYDSSSVGDYQLDINAAR